MNDTYLSISLLGKLSIRCKDEDITASLTRKARELLCYLLLNRGKPQLRESIADTLWSNCSNSEPKKLIRQTLWQLQTALGNGAEGGLTLLTIESERICFNPQASVWLDVAEFEHALEQARTAHTHGLNDARASALRRAVALYSGDLIEGWYQDWCLIERERFQNNLLHTLDHLVDLCVTQQAYSDGIDYAERILRMDSLHEHAHQQLMRLHFALGDRASALRAFQHCANALREELNIAPSPQTLRLLEQIRSSTPIDPAPALYGASNHLPESSTNEPNSLGDVMCNLRALQATLAGAQAEILRNIQKLEHLLYIEP